MGFTTKAFPDAFMHWVSSTRPFQTGLRPAESAVTVKKSTLQILIRWDGKSASSVSVYSDIYGAFFQAKQEREPGWGVLFAGKASKTT